MSRKENYSLDGQDRLSPIDFTMLLLFRFLRPMPRRIESRSRAVFTEAKSGINDPGLNQRRQFCPDFQFVWTKWSRWRKLLSHWLLWRADLWFQPILSDFLHCPKLFMNSTNFQQKILDYLIPIISSLWIPPQDAIGPWSQSKEYERRHVLFKEWHQNIGSREEPSNARGKEETPHPPPPAPPSNMSFYCILFASFREDNMVLLRPFKESVSPDEIYSGVVWLGHEMLDC